VHERNYCEREFGKIIRQEGQRLLGWRTVPVDEGACGPLARTNMPEIRQIFIGAGRATRDQASLERKLFIIRKRIERQVRESNLKDREFFYLPSLSSRTMVYKGLLLPEQIPAFYHDLMDPTFVSALAVVHSASRPTPSPPGSGRTPTAFSPTTAKSTRCAATSTGCSRARRCSVPIASRTCASSSRSSIPPAATRRCSTTRSSSSCTPAARSPMP
jgi:hypothetical protein